MLMYWIDAGGIWDFDPRFARPVLLFASLGERLIADKRRDRIGTCMIDMADVRKTSYL